MSHDEVLGTFLSDANPFLWADASSADPAIYVAFASALPEKIEIKNSYHIITKYLSNLDIQPVADAFSKVDKETWETCARKYLAEPHKGQEPYL